MTPEAAGVQPVTRDPRREKASSLPFALSKAGFTVLSRVSPSAAALIAERVFLTPRRRGRPDHERALLETARRFVVPSADGPLSACEWGESGERVLLVHGWEGRGTQLGFFVQPLLDRGFRVVAFDAPAHGDSPGSLSSFMHFARAIRAVADVGAPLAGLVAHSMGGASAGWASRAGPITRRMVMIAPPADLSDFTREASRQLGSSLAARTALEKRLARRLGVNLSEVEVSRVAAEMTTPLLVVHDEDDRDVPIEAGERCARAWPGAELMRTRGLGHRRVLRDPQVIDAVTRFVTA